MGMPMENMYEPALCGIPNVTEYDVSTLWIFLLGKPIVFPISMVVSPQGTLIIRGWSISQSMPTLNIIDSTSSPTKWEFDKYINYFVVSYNSLTAKSL